MADEDNGGNAELEARIAQEVEKAVAGLKDNANNLKNEKTEMKQKHDALASLVESLGGADALKGLGSAETVKQLAEMRKRLEHDESGKLLTEGKYDEWFDKRVGGMRKDYENQIGEYQKKLDDAQKNADGYLTNYRQKVLETEVAAAVSGAGIEPTALLDVQLRAQNTFKFDPERDQLVLRDSDGGIIFGKDGKSPKTVREWLDDQKEVSRHWWPASKGGGAEGSGLGGGAKGLENLDMRSYGEARRKSGFKPY